MEGWGWQSVHDPEVLPTVMERWTSSIATGEPFEMTFPLRGSDGVFRPFLTRVQPVRDMSGARCAGLASTQRLVHFAKAKSDIARCSRTPPLE